MMLILLWVEVAIFFEFMHDSIISWFVVDCCQQMKEIIWLSPPLYILYFSQCFGHCLWMYQTLNILLLISFEAFVYQCTLHLLAYKMITILYSLLTRQVHRSSKLCIEMSITLVATFSVLSLDPHRMEHQIK